MLSTHYCVSLGVKPYYPPPDMSIAARIKEARLAVGLSQEGLAQEIKRLRGLRTLSRTAVWQWESDKGVAPAIENLAAVAAVTGFCFEYLATGREPRVYSPADYEAPAASVGESGAEYDLVPVRDPTIMELLEAVKKLRPEERRSLTVFVEDVLSVRRMSAEREKARSEAKPSNDEPSYKRGKMFYDRPIRKGPREFQDGKPRSTRKQKKRTGNE